MCINQSNALSTPSKHLMLASQKCPEMLVDSSRCPAGRTLGHFSLGLRPRATGVRGHERHASSVGMRPPPSQTQICELYSVCSILEASKCCLCRLLTKSCNSGK